MLGDQLLDITKIRINSNGFLTNNIGFGLFSMILCHSFSLLLRYAHAQLQTCQGIEEIARCELKQELRRQIIAQRGGTRPGRRPGSSKADGVRLREAGCRKGAGRCGRIERLTTRKTRHLKTPLADAAAPDKKTE